jgi:hypothetical protein
MTVQCCKCKRVRAANEWSKPHEIMHDAVSHTYCPDCLSVTRAEIKEGLKLMGLRPHSVVSI